MSNESGSRGDIEADLRPELESIEVFPTGGTLLAAPDEGELAEHLRHGAAAVRAGYERVREIQARPGHRPGTPIVAVTSHRRGGDTDIVRPVLVDPVFASRIAASGALFERALPHLRIIEHRDDPDEARFLVWDAIVRSDEGRDTSATLHLMASPSMVVTVLELVPHRRLRWTGRQFIRDGIEALDELAARLVSAFRNAA